MQRSIIIYEVVVYKQLYRSQSKYCYQKKALPKLCLTHSSWEAFSRFEIIHSGVSHATRYRLSLVIASQKASGKLALLSFGYARVCLLLLSCLFLVSEFKFQNNRLFLTKTFSLIMRQQDSGSQTFMIRGSLPKTLNTCGPLPFNENT